MTGRKLVFIGKCFIVFAAVWAVGVSLFVFFTPITSHTIEVTNLVDGQKNIEDSISVISWFQTQGVGGTIVLILNASLYLFALFLVLRTYYRALILFCAMVVLFSILLIFSIGFSFIPSAIGLTIGTIAVWIAALKYFHQV